ncbi:MAG: PAS domain S-box protein [Candidatus Brocadiales bacterium]|nr:PAS domain S-box protein [Candidatus Brocadiales bacterium]
MEESEVKFRKISDAANDAFIMADSDGSITYWNKSAERIFGYTAEDVAGKKLHQTIIPDRFKDAHIKGFKRFIDTDQGTVIGKIVELAAIRRDKTEFPIELSLSSVKVGDRWSAIGIIRDVSDRKKAERRLNAQHAVTHILSVSTTLKEILKPILQAICESLHWEFGAFWLYHRQDDVLRCSELWHVPNIEIAEFEGKTKEISFASGNGLPGRVLASRKPAWIVDVVQDSNFPRASDALKAGLRGAVGFPVIINEEFIGTLEFFCHKKEEPDNDLLNMMSAIGSQIALFIKRSRGEEKIRKLLLAVEHSSCSVVISDVKGIIEYVNPKFTQVTGYTFEEAVGENTRILQSGKQSAEEYKGLWETITSGKEWRGEFYSKRKSGKLFWEYASISPIKDNEDVIVGFIAVKEDITRRKQIEEELRISHKMSFIGRLSASVFHEILNPVNIISAHTQLLLMEAEKGSKTEGDLKSIQGEIGRIVNITDNLLKFTKKKETKAEVAEINGLLENVLSLIKSELHLKSIKPITKFEKDLPEVMVHSSELRELFLKLITNAIEAMPEGGTLTMKTRNVRSSESGVQRAEGEISELRTPNSELRGDFVEISIEDTGCGIAKENIDNIFEPFFSSKNDVVGVGVGLGLSTSYAIIEGYGGKISVVSEEGEGATFIVILPVKT